MKVNLAKLFSPKTIAIYGVSQDTRKIGSTIFNNILAAGFTGKVFPINPKYDQLFGYRCYPKVAKVPYKVDLAIMAVPAELSMKVLNDCIEKKVKGLVIISAGYREVGEEGMALEKKIKSKADAAGITILGPNCLGLLVSDSRLNASFAATNILPGNVAFMSQSGAVCIAMLDLSAEPNLGFSHFISLGNKLSLNENDLLEYWLQSDKVRAIGAYLEEFTDGLDFAALKQKLNQEKPVVVLHPGKSAIAKQAISSHTGSMAGEDSVIRAGLAAGGITRVDSIHEAYAALSAFAWSDLPHGKKVAIVTNAGGPGVIATDELIASGLELAVLSDETQEKLRAGLPSTASAANPVDIIGDALAARYEHVIQILQSATEVDIILVLLTPQLVTQIEDTAKLLINLKSQNQKPLFAVFMGGAYAAAGLNRLSDNKVVNFQDTQMAIKTIMHLVDYAEYLRLKGKSRPKLSELAKKPKLDIARYTKQELSALPEAKVQELLLEFGFDTPVSAVVNNLEQALEFAKSNPYPLVIKATTEDIAHKTDFKAIYVGIKDAADLKSKLTKLQEGIYNATRREYPPVLIQEQIFADEELLLGTKRDGGADVYQPEGKGFGHLLMFGKGGVHTEVYNDVASALIPLSDKGTTRLISSTKISQVIDGVRGSRPLAKSLLVETVRKLQQMLVTYPEIAEMDINPLMISRKRCIVVDAKIFVKK